MGSGVGVAGGWVGAVGGWAWHEGARWLARLQGRLVRQPELSVWLLLGGPTAVLSSSPRSCVVRAGDVAARLLHVALGPPCLAPPPCSLPALLPACQLPSHWGRYYVVCGLGLLWAILAGSLLLATEFLGDATSRWAGRLLWWWRGAAAAAAAAT